MPQDIFSGRQGNEDGRRIAGIIAIYLNIILAKGSNECTYKGKKTVIKSAKYSNTNFGITNAMLDRVEQIILAKQAQENEPFHLYLVPADKIKPFGRETRSKGPAAGKVTDFRVSKAIEFGTNIGSIDVLGS